MVATTVGYFDTEEDEDNYESSRESPPLVGAPLAGALVPPLAGALVPPLAGALVPPLAGALVPPLAGSLVLPLAGARVARLVAAPVVVAPRTISSKPATMIPRLAAIGQPSKINWNTMIYRQSVPPLIHNRTHKKKAPLKKPLSQSATLSPLVHEVPSSIHEVPLSIHEVPLSIHEVPLSIHAMPSPIHEVPLSIHAMPSSMHAIPLSIHTIPLSIHEVPLSIHEVPLSTPEVMLSTPEVMLSTHDLSTPEVMLSTHEVPLSTHEVPLSTHEVPLSTPEVMLATLEVPMSTQEVPPSNHDIVPPSVASPPIPASANPTTMQKHRSCTNASTIRSLKKQHSSIREPTHSTASKTQHNSIGLLVPLPLVTETIGLDMLKRKSPESEPRPPPPTPEISPWPSMDVYPCTQPPLSLYPDIDANGQADSLRSIHALVTDIQCIHQRQREDTNIRILEVSHRLEHLERLMAVPKHTNDRRSRSCLYMQYTVYVGCYILFIMLILRS